LEHTGEAQYLHGHHGELTVEVEGTPDERGFIVPVGEIKKILWDYMRNFDHALLLQDTDPLLPVVLAIYEKQGILHGAPDNTNTGVKFKSEFAEVMPECRLVITKKITTVENMLEIFYAYLKDRLNIKRMRFQSKDDVVAVLEVK
jgi:6-pyruvoyltetrahydropterin/6-carboxytetrahydropterin synthase